MRQTMNEGRRAYRIWVAVLILLFPTLTVWGESTGTTEIKPRIVAFGDSLTAGLGVKRDDAYPAQLQRRLEELGFRYQVINAGVSGDTTAGGLRRVGWVLSAKPEIVILELGANDGLRGLGLEQTKNNLDHIIRQLRQADVTVILAGMKLPPNYGREYTEQFESIYPALANRYRLPLIPFFLEGVAASSKLNQADGIHPTKEGYEIVVEQILKVLTPVLQERKRKF
ncbi:arylesterase [Candidatus Nitrospira inopinata]|uniref:arylesterase n=1 Tax=Candidatus Nitrospira inopinata TaxID=1715989 RepID=UPI001E5D1B32|nr:arylesterase [Candidatus Nitrospira inopinata]